MTDCMWVHDICFVYPECVGAGQTKISIIEILEYDDTGTKLTLTNGQTLT